MSLVAESPDFLQVYSDGTVKRFAPETAPPCLEPSNDPNGFRSKDVVIDPLKPITGRLFLPPSVSSSEKLPVLVYFHGGGFCIGSTTWLGYHVFLGEFSATSRSIVLSVDYRLAPEHRLPTAYEDCYAAIEWLRDQASTEPWLQQAELSRVFLSGDSAGANIAHHVAVKTIQKWVCPVKIKGIMLMHPYFGSEKRTEKEMEDGGSEDVKSNDMFWKLSIPEGSNRDYFGCNFEKANLPERIWSKFLAIEVHVAGLDFLKERGVMYAEFVKKNGVKDVKLVEAKGEKHIYHVLDPKSDAARLLQKQMSQFMKRF
ncbi:hypothetical protein AAHE18_16G240300 [Arachis hypogaea]